MHKSLSEINELQQHPIIRQLKERLATDFPDKHFVIGCSGGYDSLMLAALFNLLCPNRTRLLHINHQLQPLAQEWQQQVESWAATQQLICQSIPVYVESVGNLESNARKARYAAFSDAIESHEILVLGHNLTDQIETLFLRLMKGSGLKGLGSIQEVSHQRHLCIWRPLLSFTRADYADLYQVFDLQPVQDPMNLDEKFDRVWVRQQILPLLIGHHPAAFSNISRSIQHLQHAAQLLASTFPQFDFSSDELSIASLEQFEMNHRAQILYQWLSAHCIEADAYPNTKLIKEINIQLLEGRHDNQAEINWGKLVITKYNKYLRLISTLEKKTRAPSQIIQTVNNALIVDWQKKKLTLQITTQILFFPLANEFGIALFKPFTKQMRSTIPQRPLLKITAHNRQGGEKILLNTKAGTQSLKKLFQQWKIAPWHRQQSLIIRLEYKNWSITQLLFIPDYAPILSLYNNISYQFTSLNESRSIPSF